MARPRILSDEERTQRIIASKKRHEQKRKEFESSFSIKCDSSFVIEMDDVAKLIGISRRQLILDAIKYYIESLEKINLINTKEPNNHDENSR